MASRDSSAHSSIADLAALGRLFDRHRPALLSMLRRRIDRGLAVRVDAEDVFQEACIEASRRWGEFQRNPQGDAYVWLYGIVRDQLLRTWRDQNRKCRAIEREERWPEQSAEALVRGLFVGGPSPRTEAERREMNERTAKAVELLSDSDYEIVKLRHFDQLSFSQCGQLLGVTENTAAVRYARALKRLRSVWDAIYGEEP